jgi:catechol 2,3-dioxygenase-like lactoylglutathione lyase family enzyme
MIGNTAMSSDQPVVSPVRSVLLAVDNLKAAKDFYEQGLGMTCIQEATAISGDVRDFWGIGPGAVNMALMAQPDDPFGMVELIQCECGTGQPIRDQSRPYDYGLLTLNFRTHDINAAVAHLEKFGAKCYAPPVRYKYLPDTYLYEVMLEGLYHERYTILQVGEPEPAGKHLIGDVLATVGTVVPSGAKAQAFYGDTLGMTRSFELNASGEPFSTLIGMGADTQMHMQMFTSAGNWTGKLEAINLSSAAIKSEATREKMNGCFAGYWMISMISDNMEMLAQRIEQNDYQIEKADSTVDRPFVGSSRAMLLHGPGGVPIEILANF